MAEPLVKLGPISHIGIVVEDCEKAAAFYERVFGVGPFDIQLYDMSTAPYFFADGEPAAPTFKAAIAFSGNVFIELVEVLEGETVHTKFFRERGAGLQHLAFNVRNGKEKVAALEDDAHRSQDSSSSAGRRTTSSIGAHGPARVHIIICD